MIEESEKPLTMTQIVEITYALSLLGILIFIFQSSLQI